MDYLWYDLNELNQGQVVKIDCNGTINVKLMTYNNFSLYKYGLPYRFFGGRALKTPCHITVPHDGSWILVADTELFGIFQVKRVSVIDNNIGVDKELDGAEVAAQPKELKEAIEIKSDNEYDVFISHASEDKDAVVRPLVDALKAKGIKVWYDEDKLKIGDSLSKEIDDGLKKSDFGLVVLSKAFMKKPWTGRELKGLVAGEINGKPILPIYHGVTRDEVYDFSPPLADSLARSTSNHAIDAIASEIAEVIISSKAW